MLDDDPYFPLQLPEPSFSVIATVYLFSVNLNKTELRKAFNAIPIVFTTIFTVEAFVIIMGNALTIFVFWTHRFHLKQTYFPLNI